MHRYPARPQLPDTHKKMTTPDRITVHLQDISAHADIAEMWGELEARCEVSFFQSWGWIGAWLQSLPASTPLYSIVAKTNDELAGLAILARSKVIRHKLFSSDALFLNEAGIPGYDFVIEHNGLLLKSGIEQPTLDACLRHLITQVGDWDEIFISGIRQDSPLFHSSVLKEHDVDLRVLRTSSSRYVDMEELRQSGGDYLDSLSSNTRYQIRRALRKHVATGPLTLSIAASAEEAHVYFDRMKELHQAYWAGKGEPGSFANSHWEAFHRRLISERFDSGEIQLIGVTTGDKTIGYLYNFIKNGWVYVLQSGFHYEPNHTLHPGYVSHYLAIDYNLKHGAKIYDFLAGDAQYKSSLGRNDHTLAWVVLQRKRWKFKVEDALRRLVRALKSRRKTTVT